MILGIAFMIALIFLLFKAYQLAQKTQKNIEDIKDTVTEKVNDFVSQKPSEIAGIVGMGLAGFVKNRIKDMFRRDT
jgi:hypothetical protein